MIHTALDINTIRKDFPILNLEVNGKPLCYLDNAATTHKPDIVIAMMGLNDNDLTVKWRKNG